MILKRGMVLNKMYSLDIKPYVDSIFRKLSKKNPKQLKIIGKKIEDIRKNPQHKYKYLRKPFQGFNRVHIDDSFILIFRIDHIEEVVIVYDYGHHDKIYKGRWFSD